jgi:uracil-DNA glycosylase
VSTFRTELTRNIREPINLVELNMGSEREATKEERKAFIDYLRARFHSAPPDLVVTTGTPAAHFYVDLRSQLFADTPAVIGALTESRVPSRV